MLLIMLTIELRDCVSYFKHKSISFEHMLICYPFSPFTAPNHIPLKTCVRLREVTNLGTYVLQWLVLLVVHLLLIIVVLSNLCCSSKYK